MASAIAVGFFVAVVLAYVGVVVFVLASRGIPLGTQPVPLNGREYAVLLLLAGAAATTGGRVAANIAAQWRRSSVTGVSVLLAAVMLLGFGGTNSWPDWWGPAIAAAMVAGTCIGGLVRQGHRRP